MRHTTFWRRGAVSGRETPVRPRKRQVSQCESTSPPNPTRFSRGSASTFFLSVPYRKAHFCPECRSRRFMAKWLTTARGVRRTRPLSSISRCTTTSGNRSAPKKLIGSVTPAQDHGRETCHLDVARYRPAVSEPCSLAPHHVLWQQESPCVSGKGGSFGKQSKERKGRVVVPAGAPQILD
jgi:hypothetical protein